MYLENFDDKNLAWPLSVSAPTAHELTEWAIRLDPSLAKSSPREAINSAVTLYMRAGEVGARWEQLKMEFARNQIREADGPAVVASEGDEDTMIDWLEKNTKPNEEGVRFKTRGKLLSAIDEMYEDGVAVQRTEGENGAVHFEFRSFAAGTPTATTRRNLCSFFLCVWPKSFWS